MIYQFWARLYYFNPPPPPPSWTYTKSLDSISVTCVTSYYSCKMSKCFLFHHLCLLPLYKQFFSVFFIDSSSREYSYTLQGFLFQGAGGVGFVDL